VRLAFISLVGLRPGVVRLTQANPHWPQNLEQPPLDNNRWSSVYRIVDLTVKLAATAKNGSLIQFGLSFPAKTNIDEDFRRIPAATKLESKLPARWLIAGGAA
jgi:hypothetical protein